MNNEWVEGTAQLLRKWGRISAKRKQAHYRTANSYGWQNKLLSIPIILISTILGSLSFIHPKTEKEVFFEADRPKDFDSLIKSLNKASI